MLPILPFLQRRGLGVQERETGNYEVTKYPGLLVKDSYWRWPEREMAGNTIDLCVKVLGLSFHDAMAELTQRS